MRKTVGPKVLKWMVEPSEKVEIWEGREGLLMSSKIDEANSQKN